MMTTTHGALGAPKVSDANLWMTCNGSHQAQLRHPPLSDEPSQSRLEGRACHEAAQLMFRAWRNDTDVQDVLFSDIIGRVAQCGIVITEELFDAARVYVTDVIGYCSANGLIQHLHVEERVSLGHLWPEWYGIPDAWVYNPETRTLVVWDFKAGHTVVPAENNYQLVLGAEGAAALTRSTGHHVEHVDLRIVQPRCYTSDGTIRKWTPMDGEYWNAVERVMQALPIVTGDAPPCKTGSHCRKCYARANCETLQREVYEGVDYVSQLQTHTLSGHALGVELKLLRRAQEALTARLDGLETQAMHELQAGKGVSFFGVATGKGKRRWKVDPSQIIATCDLLGVDVRKPVDVVTPAQAIKKGVDDSVMSAYSEIPSTGLKLVEVDGAHARRVFSNVNK